MAIERLKETDPKVSFRRSDTNVSTRDTNGSGSRREISRVGAFVAFVFAMTSGVLHPMAIVNQVPGALFKNRCCSLTMSSQSCRGIHETTLLFLS